MANAIIDIVWCKNNENRFITSGQDLRLYQIEQSVVSKPGVQGFELFY